MKILVIAYEYPPIIAAQSMRWFYLANELAALGVKVDILTTKIRDVWAFSGYIRPEITVHRCFPGPFVGLSGWLGGKLDHSEAAENVLPAGSGAVPRITQSLEKLYRLLRAMLDCLLFPDVRTEWLPFAWREIKALFAKQHYDLVVSSNEPGVDLILGLCAKKRWHVPWIVDLGDPVLTPYSPWWRRWLDKRFERKVCTQADHLLVTADLARDVLAARHNLRKDRFTVIPQGFDNSRSSALPGQTSIALIEKLRREFVLVYTGTFYKAFRDPSELIAAVAAVPGIHLVIAGYCEAFLQQLRTLGDRAHLFGKIAHLDCLALQKHATVLINQGNQQAYQVPGKFFEYLGANRPILHISASNPDPTAALLSRLKRGLVVKNQKRDIQKALETLYEAWRQGKLDERFDWSSEMVKDYSWGAHASRLHFVFETVGAK